MSSHNISKLLPYVHFENDKNNSCVTWEVIHNRQCVKTLYVILQVIHFWDETRNFTCSHLPKYQIPTPRLCTPYPLLTRKEHRWTRRPRNVHLTEYSLWKTRTTETSSVVVESYRSKDDYHCWTISLFRVSETKLFGLRVLIDKRKSDVNSKQSTDPTSNRTQVKGIVGGYRPCAKKRVTYRPEVLRGNCLD